MSLRHSDNSKKNGHDEKLSGLPKLEPLPELDYLFDEFDSEGLLPDENITEVEEISKSEKINKLPAIEEDELLEDSFDTISDKELHDDSTDEESDENSTQVNSDETEDIGIPDMGFEDFQTIDEKEVDDPEYDMINDDEVLNSEDDEDPYGYNLEEDEFAGSLLPGVDIDEDIYPEVHENEEEIDNPDEEDDELKQEESEESNHKELDEEKIKAFFMGLIAKFKTNKEDKKGRIKKEDKKSSNNIDKTKLMYLSIAIVAIILLVALYSMWGGSYEKLDDIEATTSIESEYDDESVDIKLSNFSINENNDLDVTLKNTGDISQSFSMYFTVKGKSLIPFLGSKIECESDIIDVEPGSEIRETLSCNETINEDLTYKITNVMVDSF